MRNLYSWLFSAYLFQVFSYQQVHRIKVDVHGNFKVVVKIGPDAYVTISPYGEILEVDIEGDIDYLPGHWDNGGKIDEIGNIEFEYRPTHWDNGGKIEEIGGVEFEYRPTHWDNGGKIEEIGDIEFEYRPTHWDNGGKLEEVGGVDIDYRPTHWDNGGKIEEIGEYDFDYRPTHWSNGGKLSSGMRSFTAGGIGFRVVGGTIDC